MYHTQQNPAWFRLFYRRTVSVTVCWLPAGHISGENVPANVANDAHIMALEAWTYSYWRLDNDWPKQATTALRTVAPLTKQLISCVAEMVGTASQTVKN
jgi:hypothetical protein